MTSPRSVCRLGVRAPASSGNPLSTVLSKRKCPEALRGGAAAMFSPLHPTAGDYHAVQQQQQQQQQQEGMQRPAPLSMDDLSGSAASYIPLFGGATPSAASLLASPHGGSLMPMEMSSEPMQVPMTNRQSFEMLDAAPQSTDANAADDIMSWRGPANMDMHMGPSYLSHGAAAPASPFGSSGMQMQHPSSSGRGTEHALLRSRHGGSGDGSGGAAEPVSSMIPMASIHGPGSDRDRGRDDRDSDESLGDISSPPSRPRLIVRLPAPRHSTGAAGVGPNSSVMNELSGGMANGRPPGTLRGQLAHPGSAPVLFGGHQTLASAESLPSAGGIEAMHEWHQHQQQEQEEPQRQQQQQEQPHFQAQQQQQEQQQQQQQEQQRLHQQQAQQQLQPQQQQEQHQSQQHPQQQPQPKQQRPQLLPRQHSQSVSSGNALPPVLQTRLSMGHHSSSSGDGLKASPAGRPSSQRMLHRWDSAQLPGLAELQHAAQVQQQHGSGAAGVLDMLTSAAGNCISGGHAVGGDSPADEDNGYAAGWDDLGELSDESFRSLLSRLNGPSMQHCMNCTSAMVGGMCSACGHRAADDGRLRAGELVEQEGRHYRAPPPTTVLAYDERLTLHQCSGEAAGNMHPERPERVSVVMARLAAARLTERCVALPCREATLEELCEVHERALVLEVQQKCEERRLVGGGATYGNEEDCMYILDCYLMQHTFHCAALAAGACIDAALAVASRQAGNGAAIIRPPGHHAEGGLAMGFCYFNNSAVAARAVQKAGCARRVLILDWDVHHGNGTQAIFDRDDTVLYMSIHRYDHGNFFPGTGAAEEVGSGAGEGYTVNVPWDAAGANDADYLATFTRILLPIAYEFAPDLVIVSAGFDAAEGDPLGGCHVSPACYGHMTALLKPLGPLLLLLEGGYNLSATAASVEACVSVLLGDQPAPLPQAVTPSRVGLLGIQKALASCSRYWRCLQPSGHPMPVRGAPPRPAVMQQPHDWPPPSPTRLPPNTPNNSRTAHDDGLKEGDGHVSPSRHISSELRNNAGPWRHDGHGFGQQQDPPMSF